MKKISFICLLLVVVLSALPACVFSPISNDGNKQSNDGLSKDEGSVLTSRGEEPSSEGQSPFESQNKPSPESYQEEYNEAKRLAESGDYVSAIRTLETILIDFPNANDVKEKIQEYEERHVKSILKNASAVFVTPSEDYGDALKIINGGLQYYPENQELKNAKNLYSKYAPLNLYDMKPFRGELEKYQTDTDTYGNSHTKSFRTARYTESIAYYDLKGEYNKFTATIYGRDDSTEPAVSVLRIVGDGAVLYENSSVSETCRPFKIDIDLTGVQELSIYMEQYSIWSDGIGMTDVILQKTAK